MKPGRRRIPQAVESLCLLLLYGCGTFTDPSTLTLQLEPLPLSADLDAQIAVAHLEKAFLHTFKHPPLLTDGKQEERGTDDVASFSSPIERHDLQLEGLGALEKTIASCPGGLAYLSHAEVTVPDQPWLDVFTACVQTTSNEQRILLGVGTVGSASMVAHAAPAHRDARINKLNQLRKAFLTLQATSPQQAEPQTVQPIKKLSFLTHHRGHSEPVSAVPLLCLAPKDRHGNHAGLCGPPGGRRHWKCRGRSYGSGAGIGWPLIFSSDDRRRSSWVGEPGSDAQVAMPNRLGEAARSETPHPRISEQSQENRRYSGTACPVIYSPCNWCAAYSSCMPRALARRSWAAVMSPLRTMPLQCIRLTRRSCITPQEGKNESSGCHGNHQYSAHSGNGHSRLFRAERQ